MTGPAGAAPARLTCAEWFDQWHAAFVGAPVTLANYRSVIERHLKPHLGSLRLRDLSPVDIKRMFVTLATGLKPSTLGQIRTVLASALGEAETLELIPRSPLHALRGRRRQKKLLPIGPSPEAQPADKSMIEHEIASLPIGDPCRMALYLALALGLRRGEICGARWRDVTPGRVTEREQIVPVGGVRPPKYGSGRELAIGPRVAQALAEHRLALAERLLACGIRLTDDHPVCAGEDGRGLLPGSLSRWCGRRGFRLHDVRHLNASLLLATEPLPVVARRLGHSRPDVTLRTYAHVLPGQDGAAAEAADRLVADR